jgi:hypothetical protein
MAPGRIGQQESFRTGRMAGFLPGQVTKIMSNFQLSVFDQGKLDSVRWSGMGDDHLGSGEPCLQQVLELGDVGAGFDVDPFGCREEQQNFIGRDALVAQQVAAVRAQEHLADSWPADAPHHRREMPHKTGVKR